MDSGEKGNSAKAMRNKGQHSFRTNIVLSACRGANSEEKNQIRVTPIRPNICSSSASMSSVHRSSGSKNRGSSMECSSINSFQFRRKNTV